MRLDFYGFEASPASISELAPTIYYQVYVHQTLIYV